LLDVKASHPIFTALFLMSLTTGARQGEILNLTWNAFGKIDINKAWNEALKRAYIEGFVFHGIRHHYATLMAREGASNLQIKTALGHKTLQMLERYSHLEAQSTRKFSENAEKRFKKSLASILLKSSMTIHFSNAKQMIVEDVKLTT